MSKEEVQTLLSDFGFEETLNKTIEGINLIHMMHCCSKLRKLVEYHIDPLGIIKSIWGFNLDDGLSMIENTVDFEIWLKK
jgi:hypothetical protein